MEATEKKNDFTTGSIKWTDGKYKCSVDRCSQIFRVDDTETKQFWVLDGHYHGFWQSEKSRELSAMKTLVILHDRENFPLELYHSLWMYMHWMDRFFN